MPSTSGIEQATTTPARRPRLTKLTPRTIAIASHSALVKPPTASSTTTGWAATRCGLVARIGHLAARGGGYRRVGPFLTPDRHRAIQNEPRSPPSHPEAAAQGDELGRL